MASSSPMVCCLFLIMVSSIPDMAAEKEEEKLGRRRRLEMESTNSTLMCSTHTGSVASSKMKAKDGREEDLTTIQWRIGLHDTLCYRFFSLEDDDGGLRGSIQITFVSLKSLYSVSNSYEFGLAEAGVRCNCDCPGGGNICYTDTNSCAGSSDDVNCVSFYSTNTSPRGCFFRFLRLSSSLCCSIRISQKSPGDRYRALQIGARTTVAELRVTHRDPNYEIVDSRMYNVDLNSGTTIDWEVSLQILGGGPTVSLPPGWYFSRENNHQDLRFNVPINGLDEWDIEKLGWFKSPSSGGREPVLDASAAEQIKRALNVQVVDCKRNLYTTEFSPSSFLNGAQQLDSGLSVRSAFPHVSSVTVWRRHVEVTHREAPIMALTLQHRNKVDIVLHYHESFLEDFSGTVVVDSSSNHFLNLTLFGVRGIIRGIVLNEDEEEEERRAIQISAGGVLLTQLRKRIKISGVLCGERGFVTARLHPVNGGSNNSSKASSPKGGIRRELRCVEKRMKLFREVNRRRKEIFSATYGQDSDSDCLSCPWTWSYWINPLNWGDGGTFGVTRMVAGTATLLLSVTVILCLAKMLCCVKKCCCS